MEKATHEASGKENHTSEVSVEEQIFASSKHISAYVNKLAHNTALRNDVEDITQEVLLKALDKIGTFNTVQGKLWPWLRVVARNTFLDRLRRNDRKPTVSLDAIEQDPFAPSFPSKDLSPLEQTILNEKHDILSKAIQELPEQQAQAIHLFLQGYAYSEIATQLDIPVGTVKSNIFRAKGAILESIKKKVVK